MELAELMTLRPEPGAGLLLTVTGRCPLHCAHCSTAATMAADEPDADRLRAFVSTFTPAEHPAVLMMTGGEPLLRPELVTDLAATARAAGTRTALLTGAFFVGRADHGAGHLTSGAGPLPAPVPDSAPVPERIWRAVTSVDHFSVSLDAFHEREVDRRSVFGLIRRVLEAGVATSFHLVGAGPDDPYLADVTADIRRTFGDRVPMLVNSLRRVGRAASWAAANTALPGAALPGTAAPDPERALPCSMAAWPVVAADGTVVACCNQRVVDRRPAPRHLTLGHIATDDWQSVAVRARTSPVLRMIRTVGPAHLLHRYGGAEQAAARPDYCAGCRALGDHPEALAAASAAASGPVGALLDRYAARGQVEAGAATLVRRHGCAPYADLVDLPGARR
ncbi:radical SAM protein [Streptomyces sp. NPDC003300]|uniref:radical SAM protein n=1 Tax=unclassified Streptomyces TaxID=2593676 RepID=UPI00339F9237